MSIKIEDDFQSLKKSLHESDVLPKEDDDTYPSVFKTLVIESIPTMLYFISMGLLTIITLHFIGKYSDTIPNGDYIIDGLGIGITLMNCATSAVIVGLNLGLVALSSQAYGAENHKLVGLFFHRGLIINIIVLTCLCFIFLFTENILVSIGIQLEVAQYSATFLKRMFGGFFMFMFMDTLKAYLIGQGIFYPQLIIQLLLVAVHWIVSQCLIIDLNLGVAGSAWAFTTTYGIGTLLLIFYIVIFKPTKKSWFFFERQSFSGLLSLVLKELSIGSMVYLEWIAFEITVFISGTYLPDQTAGQIAFYNLVGPFFCIPFGLGTTMNSFVGRAFGEKNIMKAKRYLYCTLGLCIIVILIIELILIFFNRDILEFFTDEEAIISVSQQIMIIYFFILPQDYIQTQLGAFIRATGKEKLGFTGFIICFYLIALPCCYILGTIAKYNVIGIRIGMGIGITAVLIFNAAVVYKTDFKAQVKMIHERLAQSNIQNSLIFKKADETSIDYD